MRVSPALMTFLTGLLLLSIAGILYQHSLVESGAYGTGDSTEAAAPAANVKYACPMRCVEADKPGDCPVCGMEMMPVELDTPASLAASTSAEQEYTCPMHPQIEQDHPGTCPICGMELVLKANDSAAVDPAVAESVAAVKISPLQGLLADVQVAMPEKRMVSRSVDAIGEVEVPEDRINMVVSWQPGRIDNLELAETGVRVSKGQHIMDIYSEELVRAQEEYLIALRARDQLGDSSYDYIADSGKQLLSSAESRLTRLGFTAAQLTALAETKETSEHIPLSSAYDGIVLGKYVNEGDYVMEGSKLYQVADLSELWVQMEVFEEDSAGLIPGMKIKLDCPVHPGMVFNGELELIEPMQSDMTRTQLARVRVANPDMILRPGMLVRSSFQLDRHEALMVVRNAVLQTGDGAIVYVARDGGMWEPRNVTTGLIDGDMIEITAGLAEGEGVASTAVFLLDSEAQIKGIPRIDENAIEEESHSAAHVH
ncbi:MAG: efflux RND transporter periplasmic adaptor subunit [Planctomycetales bacterium]|nr:efflux RND transporter periplasmic adaptor subunit [bacterium]UNM07797.1 MAG: efflux RND transporter periplasmic adaptor subunit [Planctomycetales bacterium]